MHPHAALIMSFYEAFRRRDSKGMSACYHPAVVFSDPAFGELRAATRRARCGRCSAIAPSTCMSPITTSSPTTASAAPIGMPTTPSRARDAPSTTPSRPDFAFKDGLIARHTDRFSFWRWSRQALGPVGLWLGWTPFLRAKVRANARAGLQDWVRNGGQDHSRDLYGTLPDAS